MPKRFIVHRSRHDHRRQVSLEPGDPRTLPVLLEKVLKVGNHIVVVDDQICITVGLTAPVVYTESRLINAMAALENLLKRGTVPGRR